MIIWSVENCSLSSSINWIDASNLFTMFMETSLCRNGWNRNTTKEVSWIRIDEILVIALNETDLLSSMIFSFSIVPFFWNNYQTNRTEAIRLSILRATILQTFHNKTSCQFTFIMCLCAPLTVCNTANHCNKWHKICSLRLIKVNVSHCGSSDRKKTNFPYIHSYTPTRSPTNSYQCSKSSCRKFVWSWFVSTTKQISSSNTVEYVIAKM